MTGMGGKRLLRWLGLPSGKDTADLRERQGRSDLRFGRTWPECFELEPGDKLTLIWNAPASGDASLVNFINERELVVWPNGDIDDIVILFNGGPSDGRSWKFKHLVTG